MKVLCVERDERGEYLHVGTVYTVVESEYCQKCPRRWYRIEEFPVQAPAGRMGIWTCKACGFSSFYLSMSHRAFLQRRFIPWKPEELKITEEEVKKLFSPRPTLEEAKAFLNIYLGAYLRRVSNSYDTGS